MAAYGPKPKPVLARIGNLSAYEDRGHTSLCLIFGGALTRGGYGQIRVGSMGDGSRRFAYIHRIVYEHHYGAIPDGMQIDHLCRVRHCCNPEHLEVVTQQENLRRGRVARAGRRSVMA